MTITNCICTILFNGATVASIAQPLLLATLAQFFFGFVWYALIVRSVYCRSLSVDKGVKAVAFIKQVHPTSCLYIHSLVTGFVRAAAILAAVFHAEKVNGIAAANQSLCLYSQAATAIFALVAVSGIEEAFYAQRPASLIIVNTAYNLGASLVAGLVLFFALKQ